ncbi:hypothetical protein [Asticcacaulis solisilvae]|uniref:hypothetical protein n=1 Tax=Asticcacaulis solisilvae TaxID=1217274 RepID=UPI003FD7A94C
MNRFVLTGGSLSAGVISGGVAITYDVDGQRHSATYASDGHQEVYQYSADGYVTGVTIAAMSNGSLGAAVQRVTRTNDLLGRNTFYVENNADGSTLETRHMSYDGDGRVTDETDYTYGTENGTAVTYESVIHNDYQLRNAQSGLYNGQDIGVITHSKSDQYKNGTSQPSTETTYSYAWWTSAKTATVTATGQTTGNSVYSYDGDGFLYELQDTGVNRKIFYQTDMAGQVVSRREWYVSAQTGNYTGGAGRDFFYLDEHAIGDVGTDSLSDRIDYAQQLANDKASSTTVTQAWTTFDYTTPAGNLAGNIDINYEAYNAATLDQSTSSFTALGGESLQDVAQNLWGDSSLWYILADANGLYADTTLSAGQTLRIPAKPANIHNNASTFKVYDPADTMGNTKPTQPQPPQRDSGCGFVGEVVMIAIAVIVTAVVAPWAEGYTMQAATAASAAAADAAATAAVAATTAAVSGSAAAAATAAAAAATAASAAAAASSLALVGAVEAGAIAGLAGGLASQAFAVAAGIQSRVNWGAVAMGTISGGIGGGLGQLMPGTDLATTVQRGLATNVVSQGIDIAARMQKKFDWTSVAVSGAEGAASAWAGELFDTTPNSADASTRLIERGLATGGASLTVGVMVRSMALHQSLGKSLREALPDAIGNTIGGIIADEMQQHDAQMQAIKKASSLDVVTAQMNDKVEAVKKQRTGKLSQADLDADAAAEGELKQNLQNSRDQAASSDETIRSQSARTFKSAIGSYFDKVFAGDDYSDIRQGIEAQYRFNTPDQKYDAPMDYGDLPVTNHDPRNGYLFGPVDWASEKVGSIHGQIEGGIADFRAKNPAADFLINTAGVVMMAANPVAALEGMGWGVVQDKSKDVAIGVFGQEYSTVNGQNPNDPTGYVDSQAYKQGDGLVWGVSLAIQGPQAIAGVKALGTAGIVGFKRLATHAPEGLGGGPSFAAPPAAETAVPPRLTQGLKFEADGVARASTEAYLPGQSTQRLSVRAFNADGTLAEGRTVLDLAGYRLDNGQFGALEFKLSTDAPLTARQQLHFPLLEQNGGVIVGAKGEAIGLPAGAKIAPTTPVRVNGPTYPQPGEWWKF